jgi:hypothetical protein
MDELVGTEETWKGFEGRYPAGHVSVAHLIWDEIANYVRSNRLDWMPAAPAGRWWVGYKRSGRYFVVTVALYVEKPVQLAVKIPDSPEALGLENPYPQLDCWWDEAHRQWAWAVPSRSAVPDVAGAIDISRRYQPDTGPMRPPVTA